MLVTTSGLVAVLSLTACGAESGQTAAASPVAATDGVSVCKSVTAGAVIESDSLGNADAATLGKAVDDLLAMSDKVAAAYPVDSTKDYGPAWFLRGASDTLNNEIVFMRSEGRSAPDPVVIHKVQSMARDAASLCK